MGNSFTDSDVIVKSEFSGVNKVSTDKSAFEINLKDVGKVDIDQNIKGYSKYMNAKRKAKNKTDLEFIKSNILPSCSSQLITCEYTLKFKFSHKGVFFFGQNLPTVTLPLWIQLASLSTPDSL